MEGYVVSTTSTSVTFYVNDPGAVYYDAYCYQTSSTSGYVSSNTITFSGLYPSSSYTFALISYDASYNWINYVDNVAATTAAPPEMTLTVAPGATSIRIQVAEPVTMLEVIRYSDYAYFYSYDTQEIIVDGCSPSTEYSLKVSGWNNGTTVGVNDNLLVTTTAAAAPPAPTVTCSSSNEVSIFLSFQATDANNYEVKTASSQAILESGGGTVIYNGSSTTFDHTNLEPNTTYYYRVIASFDALSSDPTYANFSTAALPAVTPTTPTKNYINVNVAMQNSSIYLSMALNGPGIGLVKVYLNGYEAGTYQGPYASTGYVNWLSRYTGSGWVSYKVIAAIDGVYTTVQDSMAYVDDQYFKPALGLYSDTNMTYITSTSVRLSASAQAYQPGIMTLWNASTESVIAGPSPSNTPLSGWYGAQAGAVNIFKSRVTRSSDGALSSVQYTIIKTPPAAPTKPGLTVTGAIDDSVTLSYSSSGATSYSVYQDYDYTTPVYSGPNASCTISGLGFGTEHRFEVKAINDAGESPLSDARRIATTGNVSKTGSTANSITLYYYHNLFTSYGIYHSIYRNGELISENNSNYSFTDNGLTPGTEYSYVIKWFVSMEDLPYEVEHSAVAYSTLAAPPDAPTVNHTATTNSVTLTYSSPGATSYRITHMNELWQEYPAITFYEGALTSWTQEYLSPNQIVRYRVRAINAGGTSAPTDYQAQSEALPAGQVASVDQNFDLYHCRLNITLNNVGPSGFYWRIYVTDETEATSFWFAEFVGNGESIRNFHEFIVLDGMTERLKVTLRRSDDLNFSHSVLYDPIPRIPFYVSGSGSIYDLVFDTDYAYDPDQPDKFKFNKARYILPTRSLPNAVGYHNVWTEPERYHPDTDIMTVEILDSENNVVYSGWQNCGTDFIGFGTVENPLMLISETDYTVNLSFRANIISESEVPGYPDYPVYTPNLIVSKIINVPAYVPPTPTMPDPTGLSISYIDLGGNVRGEFSWQHEKAEGAVNFDVALTKVSTSETIANYTGIQTRAFTFDQLEYSTEYELAVRAKYPGYNDSALVTASSTSMEMPPPKPISLAITPNTVAVYHSEADPASPYLLSNLEFVAEYDDGSTRILDPSAANIVWLGNTNSFLIGDPVTGLYFERIGLPAWVPSCTENLTASFTDQGATVNAALTISLLPDVQALRYFDPLVGVVDGHISHTNGQVQTPESGFDITDLEIWADYQDGSSEQIYVALEPESGTIANGIFYLTPPEHVGHLASLYTENGITVMAAMEIKYQGPPILERIDPTLVHPGQSMYHIGQSFGDFAGRVMIENTQLQTTTWSDTATESILPMDIPGGVMYTWVENSSGVSNKLEVTVTGTLPRPIITDPTLHFAMYGQVFTIYGQYFQKTPGSVEFLSLQGRTTCEVRSWSLSVIEVVIPETTDLEGLIVVVNEERTMSNEWPVTLDSTVIEITDPTTHRTKKGSRITVYGKNIEYAGHAFFGRQEEIPLENVTQTEAEVILPNSRRKDYLVLTTNQPVVQEHKIVFPISNAWQIDLTDKIEITNAQPNPCFTGDTVHIVGSGFGTVQGRVELRTSKQTFDCPPIATTWHEDSVEILIKAGYESGDLYVIDVDGNRSNPWPIEVGIREEEKPVITFISPEETGEVPCQLKIYGRNLIPAAAAFVGSVQLDISLQASSDQDVIPPDVIVPPPEPGMPPAPVVAEFLPDGLHMLKATVPANAVSANVFVSAPKGRPMGPVFYILDPIIEYIAPNLVTERKDTYVDVYGQRLNSQFTFNGIAVPSIQVGDHYKIFITADMLVTGPVKCRKSNSVTLTVKIPKDPPEITSFSVEKASFETNVIVYGLNFGPSAATGKLLVNGKRVNTLAWSDTAITMYIDDFFVAGDIQVIRYDEE